MSPVSSSTAATALAAAQPATALAAAQPSTALAAALAAAALAAAQPATKPATQPAAALAPAQPGGARVLSTEPERKKPTRGKGLLQQLGADSAPAGRRMARYQGGSGASLRAAPGVHIPARLELRWPELALLLVGDAGRDGRGLRQPALQRRAAAVATALAAALVAQPGGARVLPTEPARVQW